VKGTKTTTSTKTISGKLRSWVSGPNKLSTNKSVGFSPRQPTKIRQPNPYVTYRYTSRRLPILTTRMRNAPSSMLLMRR